MENTLVKEVTDGLAARKREWQTIADELAPDVSLSMIEKLGRRKYTSSPTIGKLEKIAKYLRENPVDALATPARKKAAVG